jgi:tRNA-Thr(GGU) m(6)t(6)A37 methyltransferase TsaA
MEKQNFEIKPIGVIRTPYKDVAPFQPIEYDENEFIVELFPEYVQGLENLNEFKYIFLFYYLHRVKKKVEMLIKPPWAKGKKVGLFASRSPARPNPIGISVVKIKKIEGNKIYTGGLDVFDGTPLIDIKPYIKNLDEKSNADYGWLDNLDDKEHLTMHIKGIPHTH